MKTVNKYGYSIVLALVLTSCGGEKSSSGNVSSEKIYDYIKILAKSQSNRDVGVRNNHFDDEVSALLPASGIMKIGVFMRRDTDDRWLDMENELRCFYWNVSLRDNERTMTAVPGGGNSVAWLCEYHFNVSDKKTRLDGEMTDMASTLLHYYWETNSLSETANEQTKPYLRENLLKSGKFSQSQIERFSRAK